jgi:alkylation response protein AidB-like acyl-CoA dehydrogenase
MISTTATIPPTEAGFRAAVREVLAETALERPAHQYFMDRSGRTAELYRELGARGWLSVSWPADVGGAGMPAAFEFAMWDELAYARAARPSIAVGLIGKSIIDAGTPEQRKRLLPGVAAGNTSFALGYSEPEAGSDLTGLRTRAVRDGDSYVVTGEKRWTSDAHHAGFLWLLCRTGDLKDRSKGLTLLVVDTSSPGIEISPLPMLDGHNLNEVRLDGVVVPADNRIGGEGEAWSVIQAALARERHLQILPGRLRRDAEDLCAWVRDSGHLGHQGVRERIAAILGNLDVVTVTARRILDAVEAGEDSSLMAARQKVVGNALMQEIARLPLEFGDARQLCDGEPFEFAWRECILETIGGGTTEIMLSNIARRALGLGQ